MLTLESYEEHEKHLPAVGKFIIAQFQKDSVIVYQAFKHSIAAYAVKHQQFGGPDYDFERITRLKPSFLWMMYYSGWAKKEDQENVLAIRIRKDGFDEILHNAQMPEKGIEHTGDVQVYWETYHDLYGNKTDRKAVKIALSGEMMQRYNNMILEIQNITHYVKEQQRLVKENHILEVRLPRERAYAPQNLAILKRIDATTISM